MCLASDYLVLQKDAGQRILAMWLSSISQEKRKRSRYQARLSTSPWSSASVITRWNLSLGCFLTWPLDPVWSWCHQCYLWSQVGSEFAQKNYSSGTRLLTAFSDGSAQLLYPVLITAKLTRVRLLYGHGLCCEPYRLHISYPSGSLAVAVMDTEDTGRVCIVYDDSSTPSEATRAIFHSDGRAKCYHSNRNIW